MSWFKMYLKFVRDWKKYNHRNWYLILVAIVKFFDTPLD